MDLQYNLSLDTAELTKFKTINKFISLQMFMQLILRMY